VGPQILLQNSETANAYNIKCKVNDVVRLHADVTILGIVPAPNNVTVDNDGKLLQWSYVLQPSNLPSDFKLLHDFNITYLVHVKFDRDDGVEAVTTITVPALYLNLDVLDMCKRQEFTVQAVINNELKSENRSVVSHLSVPVFGNLSASLQVEERSVFIVLVSFELLQRQCLSVFIIITETKGAFTFNVTSEDIRNGSTRFTLPLNVTEIDVCNVSGVIFGGNDAGNSTRANIQLPSECLTSPSSSRTPVISTITGTPSSTPPHTTASPTISSPSSSGVPTTIITAVLVPLVVVTLLTTIIIVIAIVIVCVTRKNKVTDKPESDPKKDAKDQDKM
jgi:hypothetical protein